MRVGTSANEQERAIFGVYKSSRGKREGGRSVQKTRGAGVKVREKLRGGGNRDDEEWRDGRENVREK